MSNSRLQYLFNQYVQGNCTPEEKRELSALALAMQYDTDVRELLDQYWNKVSAEMVMPEDRSDNILKSVLDNEMKMVPKVHRIHFRKSRWWAAAAILILFATGSYFLFVDPRPTKGGVQVAATTKDVKAPETNRAMITLADGRTVALDSVVNGTLAVQGNVNVIKTDDGQIVYNGFSTVVEYNTMFNPRGSKVVNLTLSDGTKVWLNSESSLRYPTAFTGNERVVEITGEAYFEVTKDATKKFIVTGNGVTTEVLGTHFNVNTYTDETSIKVTLLEGSVKVVKGTFSGMLKPGQQAQVSSDIKIVNVGDVEEVMAWKNGRFQFNKASLQEVMRQIARWYDVEISYEGKIAPQQFGGKMQRDLNLSEVLDGLAKSQVHFRIEGRKVVVMPLWK